MSSRTRPVPHSQLLPTTPVNIYDPSVYNCDPKQDQVSTWTNPPPIAYGGPVKPADLVGAPGGEVPPFLHQGGAGGQPTSKSQPPPPPPPPSLGHYGHYVPTAATANLGYNASGAGGSGGLTTVESAGVRYAGESGKTHFAVAIT